MRYNNPIYGIFNETSTQEQKMQRQFHNSQIIKTYECVHKLEDFLRSVDELAPQYRELVTAQCFRLLGEYLKEKRI